MTRRDLTCVLLGILLTTGAFAFRVQVERIQQLESRLAYVEGYLGMLDKLLRSAQ